MPRKEIKKDGSSLMEQPSIINIQFMGSFLKRTWDSLHIKHRSMADLF